jgi:hypothetical protein
LLFQNLRRVCWHGNIHPDFARERNIFALSTCFGNQEVIPLQPAISPAPSDDSTSVESRLQQLEKRLAGLEQKGKDGWDKFQIIATLLIPASIALVGYYYSNAMKDAEIKSSREMADQQNATSKISAKVGQAQLVSSFMEALVSDNPQKQQLAVGAILLALPEEGPKLVAVVSQSSPNQDVRRFARDSLDQRRAQLIEGIFDSDKSVRISSTQELLAGWHSDQGLVPSLLEAAARHPESQDGIVNTLVLLESIDKNLLLKHETEIRSFLGKVESNGDVTRQHANAVRGRIS